MANIVMPVRANLLLQMLLELEICLTIMWAVTYLLLIIASQLERHLLATIGAYLLAVCIAGVRIYCGFVLNLSPNLRQANCLLLAMLGLCLPLLAALWYVRWSLETGSGNYWNGIVWNVMVFFIGLDIIVLCILWPKTVIRSRDWYKMETLLASRQQRGRRR